MPAGALSKLLGTIASFFQFGNATGPGVNANAGALEARNASNSAFAVMRGAPPVGSNDLATKSYVDTVGSGIASSGLSSARPVATGSGKLYLCTDVPVMYFDSPSAVAWQQFLVPPVPAAAAAGSYTTTGNISLSSYADVLRATVFSEANSIGSCALIANGGLGSAQAWTVELAASVQFANVVFQYPEIGIAVANGTTSGVSNAWGLAAVILNTTSTAISLHQEQIGVGALSRIAVNNEFTGFITDFLTNAGGILRFRLIADGTNLHYQYSPDGFHWVDWWTAATPALLTHFGFWLGNDFSSGANNWVQALIYKNNVGAPTVAQSSVQNAVGSPITITTTAPHGLSDGDRVAIHGVLGNTNANSGTGQGYNGGSFLIHVTGASTFVLQGINTNAPYISGGTVTLISR